MGTTYGSLSQLIWIVVEVFMFSENFQHFTNLLRNTQMAKMKKDLILQKHISQHLVIKNKRKVLPSEVHQKVQMAIIVNWSITPLLYKSILKDLCLFVIGNLIYVYGSFLIKIIRFISLKKATLEHQVVNLVLIWKMLTMQLFILQIILFKSN